MDLIAAWSGFLGAWLLVAGPTYQGAVELRDMNVDRTMIMSHAAQIPHRERISPWWWLLPPIAYVMARRREAAWKHEVTTSLDPRQRAEFVAYANKATAWFIVSIGAGLIGIKEAAELVEALEWPALITIPMVLLALGIALGYTVLRMHLTERVLRADEQAA